MTNSLFMVGAGGGGGGKGLKEGVLWSYLSRSGGSRVTDVRLPEYE